MSENVEEAPAKLYYDSLSVARRTSQKIHLVSEHDKKALLKHLIKNNAYTYVIVIIKTKREADVLSDYLNTNGITARAIHANKNAKECENALASYNSGETTVLIMTDMILQAQCLPVINQVFSYHIPLEVEHYYARLTALEEKGEGIALVSEEEHHIMDTIQWAMKVEILEEIPEGFTPSPPPVKQDIIKKDKTKKPRHKKSKIKKEIKKKDNE